MLKRYRPDAGPNPAGRRISLIRGEKPCGPAPERPFAIRSLLRYYNYYIKDMRRTSRRRRPAAPGADPHARREVKALAEKKETEILLVDDDEDLSAVTADFLEDDGLSVNCRQSGEEALRALNGTRYRLLILDINLPDMTGFELCRKLRQATDVPILIVSARTSDTDRVTGLDLGGDDYISKPYSLRELLARVRANLRRSYHMEIRPRADVFYFGTVCLDLGARTVTKAGRWSFPPANSTCSVTSSGTAARRFRRNGFSTPSGARTAWGRSVR